MNDENKKKSLTQAAVTGKTKPISDEFKEMEMEVKKLFQEATVDL